MPTADPVYRARRKRLLAELETQGLDALVTFNLKNVRYLTGYSGTNGVVVAGAKGAFFLTDFRYAAQVKEEVRSMKRVVSTRPLAEEAAGRLAALKAKRIGFEGHHLPFDILARLRRGSKGKWMPCRAVERLRMVKDETELALLKKNFGLLENAYSGVGEIIVPGRLEREAAAMLEYRLRMAGGEKAAFDFIVASGARSALPHGVAGEKRMKKGEPVILDWGWVFGGYHSDNTRTLFLGKPPRRMREVFDIVLEANRRAIARTAPGVPLAAIDAAARDYIVSKGYGEYFGHGTGHGLGLNIHEAPSVNSRSKEIAREGMVFTIEPGIYLPGIGGVRIEDVVAVTKTGCRVLSERIPKTLRLL